ncbi:MAG: hypothetical protein HKO86_02010 [Gammaproteobacteria bacterium]|nr:hypothetical protein [Gammaproteobacteria bacterium]
MSRSRWLQLLRRFVVTRPAFAALLICYFPHPNALAFDFKQADVFEQDGVYHIKMSAAIKAPPEYVRYVLADYDHIYRLSTSIIESEVLPDNLDGEKQVRTRLLLCTSVFCTEAERVDIVRMLASGDLEAEIVPDSSEFKSGKATWRITPMDDNSFLVYEAVLEPDFFIPPLVGTRLVIENLRKEFTKTFKVIEKIAVINLRRTRSAEHFLYGAAPRILRVPCPRTASASLP